MSFTGATAGYQAGAQANEVVLSYALEESYGVPPGGNWQRLRLSGETFRVQKTRQRPEEIEASGESSRAVTTQVSVSGTLSGALSFQTYDDLLCGVMGADFTPISRVAAVGLPVLAQQDDYHGVKFKDLYDTGTLIPSLGPGGFFPSPTRLSEVWIPGTPTVRWIDITLKFAPLATRAMYKAPLSFRTILWSVRASW